MKPLLDHHLYLPKLQKRSPIRLDSIRLSSTSIFIEVSALFAQSWEKGPKDPYDEDELYHHMIILCTTFCQLVKHGQGQVKITQKSTPLDLVTDMDKGVEMLLRIWLNHWYPHHKIVGEEGTKECFGPQEYLWYIDPVDGTSNFVEGRLDVSMHVGCFKNGKPILCFVGLPFENSLYASHHLRKNIAEIDTQDLKEKSISVAPLTPSHTLGTEYMKSRTTESRLFQTLCTSLHMRPHQVRSIGVNIVDILRGKNSCFYKPGAKLWDIMPPLGLLHLAFGQNLAVSVWYPSWDAQPALSKHLFNPDKGLLSWTNTSITANCRIGLIIASSTTEPHIEETIVSVLRSHNLRIS